MKTRLIKKLLIEALLATEIYEADFMDGKPVDEVRKDMVDKLAEIVKYLTQGD